MATQIQLSSAPGTGANAVELIESRRGGGNVQDMSAWEERTYAMQFSDTTWNTFSVYYASGVPAYGLNISGTNLYLIDKRIDADPGDQTVVRCVCRFETPRPDQRQPHINATTSVWSVVKKLTTVPVEVPVERDINNKVCVNVIGEAFDPPITLLRQDAQFDITFLTNNSTSQYQTSLCEGCVNASSFTLTIGSGSYFVDNGEFYLEKTNISDAWEENGSRCSSVQLLVLWRANSAPGAGDAWAELRPNKSLHYANNTSSPMSQVRQIMNNDGPATDPHYLDSVGSVIPPGGTITMNSFTVKETANMTSLLSQLIS